MSAEIVNLRQARKQKQRRTKEKTAESNRQKFGRTKAEREADRRRTIRPNRGRGLVPACRVPPYPFITHRKRLLINER